MLTHKIKVIPKDEIGTFDVEMDDIRIDSIEDVQIDMHAGDIPRVRITFMAAQVDVTLPRAEVEDTEMEEN